MLGVVWRCVQLLSKTGWVQLLCECPMADFKILQSDIYYLSMIQNIYNDKIMPHTIQHVQYCICRPYNNCFLAYVDNNIFVKYNNRWATIQQTLHAPPPKPNQLNINLQHSSHQPNDSCDTNKPTNSLFSSNITLHAKNYSTNTSNKPKKHTVSHTSSTSALMITKYYPLLISAPNNIKSYSTLNITLIL